MGQIDPSLRVRHKVLFMKSGIAKKIPQDQVVDEKTVWCICSIRQSIDYMHAKFEGPGLKTQWDVWPQSWKFSRLKFELWSSITPQQSDVPKIYVYRYSQLEVRFTEKPTFLGNSQFKILEIFGFWPFWLGGFGSKIALFCRMFYAVFSSKRLALKWAQIIYYDIPRTPWYLEYHLAGFCKISKFSIFYLGLGGP